MSRRPSRDETDQDLKWFHGEISRQEAETILTTDEDNREGLFLVRESPTVDGAFILSVVHNGEPQHYQINRHGDDAFFSIEDGYIVHGLDTLISLCQKEGSTIFGPLNRPCKKDVPPLDTRRHGRCNLLHRATKEGNLTVVSELLRGGYRSIDAKNEAGQTAIHLAASLGNTVILKLLIQGGGNVNVKDDLDLTPLHYACINNHAECVKLLLESRASPQIRNRATGMVPLHEAASRGHLDCIQIMIAMCVTPLSRTKLDETPADLARKNAFYQCARRLETYQPPFPFTRKEDWYHGTISRAETERRLREGSNNHSEGTFFLIRRSSSKPGFYALSMLYVDRVYHFEICKRGQYYYIDYGPYLESLEHIVGHYMNHADGLPAELQRPIKPPVPLTEDKVVFRTITKRSLSPPPLPSRNSPRSSSPSHLSMDFGMDENLSSRIGIVSKEELEIIDTLGEGEFGFVYRGSLRHLNGNLIPVAIKTLRDGQMESNREEFLREARVMMKLEHPCIVQLIALCKGPPLMMVQELVALGSLLDYLLDHPSSVSPQFEFALWAGQIANGMMYLEERKFVHRDLAARNILLATRYQAKISDFGLSRVLGAEESFYSASKGGRWPIKWYAPESINLGIFSHASDAWSYGVTLWEMYSFGQQPYGDMSGSEAADVVSRGTRLPQPMRCPDHIYSLMLRCWSCDPSQRPTFGELVSHFESSSLYDNVQNLLQSCNEQRDT